MWCHSFNTPLIHTVPDTHTHTHTPTHTPTHMCVHRRHTHCHLHMTAHQTVWILAEMTSVTKWGQKKNLESFSLPSSDLMNNRKQDLRVLSSLSLCLSVSLSLSLSLSLSRSVRVVNYRRAGWWDIWLSLRVCLLFMGQLPLKSLQREHTHTHTHTHTVNECTPPPPPAPNHVKS